MKSFFRWPFYPILFALYPIVYLAGHNLSIISPADPLRPMIISIMSAVFLLFYFKIVIKDWHRSALLDLLVLILFFSFGHVANQVSIVSQEIMAWIWLGVFLGLAFLITKLQNVESLTFSMNVVSVGLIILSFFPIAKLFVWRIQVKLNTDFSSSLLAEMRNEQQSEKDAFFSAESPDIYYIILDSYEGGGALQRYYHFDNSDFIHGLQDRGFFVASESRSNYLTTTYSLSSALNLVYINDLPYGLFTEMISGMHINHVVDFLHDRGYEYVHFPSGYLLTDDATPDVWVSPNLLENQSPILRPSISEFEVLLLQTSLGRLVIQPYLDEHEEARPQGSAVLNQDFNNRRTRLKNAFLHLPDYVSNPQKSFIFAHMILPHNPYLYDAYGNPYEYNGRNELLGDQNDSQNNIRLYTDQLQYTNVQILDTIDRILKNAKTPPIIIIQADHGHDTFFDFEAPTPEGIDLRSSILSAMYFPGGDYSRLYPTITPVNTFRVVLNQFFNTNYPLLPDRSYLHPRRPPNSLTSKQQFSPIDPYLDQLPQQ